MKYILRAVIHENEWQRQVEDIISLCHSAKIESVLLMEESHQISMSPYILERHIRMGKIYSQIGKRLREENIGYGVNIATLVGHCDAHLEQEETLPYQKFVSSSLRESDSNYCIMDKDWVNYATEVFKIYASTHPDLIMVDDDFRSLNHSDPIGCFCPLHVKAVSENLGYTITQEELVKSVFSNEAQSLCKRKAWMEENAKAQLEALKAFRAGVDTIDSSIELGLMNSGEINHSIQGRDMALMLQTLAGNNTPCSRPLGGAYFDTVHEGIVDIFQGMALSISEIKGIKPYIISEVENWPHTLYTKSIKETLLQMKLHVLAGCDAISLNLFDYLGTPYKNEPKYKKLLLDAKAELDELEMLLKGKEEKGVSLLWKKNSALYSPSLNLERKMDNTLPLLGVPTTFSHSPVTYVYGESVEAMNDAEILNLLSTSVILSTEAIIKLREKGFSSFLGIEGDGFVETVSSIKFISSSFTQGLENLLLPTNWMRFHYKGKRIPKYKATNGAIVISVIQDMDCNYIGEGITLYKNNLGGTVVLLPIPVSTWTYNYRSMGCFLRNLTSYLCKESNYPYVVAKGINIAPFVFLDEKDKGFVALVNTGLDEEEVTLDSNLNLAKKDLKLASLSFEIVEVE